jgi:competence protein ComEC
VIGDPTVETRVPTWSESFRAALHGLRTAIGARIAAAVPGDLKGFAEAVIISERGAIPKHVNDSLQVSGLAHVLSISGLHMSLVAGGVFWIVRAVLAFFPGLALRRPIKK